MKYINAEGMVLGRLASKVAKLALEGEEVYVANVEKAIIIGNKDMIKQKYLQKRELVHPRKGPYFPKRPDMIFKRTVRGMLPYKKPRGREAYKRIKAFVGMPEKYFPKDVEFTPVPEADKGRPYKYVELGEISRELGGKF